MPAPTQPEMARQERNRPQNTRRKIVPQTYAEGGMFPFNACMARFIAFLPICQTKVASIEDSGWCGNTVAQNSGSPQHSNVMKSKCILKNVSHRVCRLFQNIMYQARKFAEQSSSSALPLQQIPNNKKHVYWSWRSYITRAASQFHNIFPATTPRTSQITAVCVMDLPMIQHSTRNSINQNEFRPYIQRDVQKRLREVWYDLHHQICFIQPRTWES